MQKTNKRIQESNLYRLIFIRFLQIMNSKISRYKFLLLMNLADDLENLLPDELEKLVSFINTLFDNKINERLTNQEYQKNNLKIKCPKCKLSIFKKNGHKNGTQRYLCKACNKSFSITTNTILSHTKIKYWQLKEFIKCLLDNKPIIKISKQLKMSQTQVYYLEIKLFKSLEEV